ncbi:MAG: ImmA/IrrE family metallo-endopeptidase [Kiritimatiellia bacterium]
MDLSTFKAPFLPKDKVQTEADNFRAKYWPKDNLPVEIHEILEFDLDMEIRTVASLREGADVDALLLGDLTTIVVDQSMFLDDRYLNRMRYSLAHEVGHRVLHPDLYTQIAHANISEWIETFQSIPDDQYRWIEQHAYEFAGRLLVPPDTLKGEFNRQAELAKQKGFQGWDQSGESALEYVAHAIAGTAPFGVSEQVIARRLRIEGIWQ